MKLMQVECVLNHVDVEFLLKIRGSFWFIQLLYISKNIFHAKLKGSSEFMSHSWCTFG